MTRICTKCNKTRPISQFRRSGPVTPSGIRPRMTSCVICEVEARLPLKWQEKYRSARDGHAKRAIERGWIRVRDEIHTLLNWPPVEIGAEELAHAFAGRCPGCRFKYSEMTAGRAALTIDICRPDEAPYWSINTRFACSTCNRQKGQAVPAKAALLERSNTVEDSGADPIQPSLFATGA